MTENRAAFEAWRNVQDEAEPEPERVYEFSEDGLNEVITESMFMAWQASRKAALEEAMAACDVVIFSANDEAPPGHRTTRAGGAVACRNKIMELWK